MKRSFVALSVLALVMASLACSRFSQVSQGSGGTGGTGGTGGSNQTGGGTETGSGNYNTKFPLPSSVVNFTDMGNGSVNFQTKMSLTDTIDWYRKAFTQQGLKERTENTAITSSTFSMVFDGDSSGQAVVIQGVDLGNGVTNVNISYQKI